jgi:ABC-2 type transport system permease protein
VNTMLMLVRREFWENRSLWIVPLAIAALLLTVAIFGTGHTSGGIHFTVGADDAAAEIQSMKEKEHAVLQALTSMPDEKKRSLYAVLLWSMAMIQGMALAIVVIFYLLDALYTERKDRSILFWKSLPVSDGQTVMSKLVVGLIVAPLVAFAVTALLQVVVAGVMSLRFGGSIIANIVPAWDGSVWMHVQGVTLLTFLVALLWYAPIASYLLLVSAWVRRNPFLWAFLPPVVIVMIEELLLDSNYFGRFLYDRAFGFLEKVDLGANFGDANQAAEIPGAVPTVSGLFESLDISAVFASPQLWLGLAAAAAMLFAAMRIRRYRDDT